MKITRHRALAPLALVAALTLTACNQGQTAEFEAEPQQNTAQEQPAQQETTHEETTEQESTEDDLTAQSAAAAGVNPVTVPDAVATVTVPARVERDPEATLDVSIHSLTREGKTLVGVFSFTLDSSADDGSIWLYHLLGNTSWRPHLIDTENLARHDVLSSTGINAVTDSQGSTYLRPGHTTYAYAAFASPPEGVSSMMASLIDGTQAVEVPIQ
ncbi:hypothetical protein [Ornithinimicrobium panacihumi]|uniref:hypothetical protein n=1 Tax=Ornithinimicrobium panacihumi TaxID=2008449 RepID=UPI003F8BEAB5